jgi:hypothetical protein
VIGKKEGFERGEEERGSVLRNWRVDFSLNPKWFLRVSVEKWKQDVFQ